MFYKRKRIAVNIAPKLLPPFKDEPHNEERIVAFSSGMKRAMLVQGLMYRVVCKEPLSEDQPDDLETCFKPDHPHSTVLREVFTQASRVIVDVTYALGYVRVDLNFLRRNCSICRFWFAYNLDGTVMTWNYANVID